MTVNLQVITRNKPCSGIAAGSFGYKLHIKLHTGVKASVNHACQTETDDNKLRANAASGLKKKYSPTY